MHGEIGGRLPDVLPPLLSLTSGEGECPLTPVLVNGAARDGPGREAVLGRLLGLLVIAAPRAWSAGPRAEAPAWYRAPGDPVAGRAPRLLQDDPARPWTVASPPPGPASPAPRSPGASPNRRADHR